MAKIKRRDFLKKTALAAAASAATLSLNSPAVHARKTHSWRMVTTWPPGFPVLGQGAELYARWVEELSGGRLRIKVFGGGELVPPLEAFDAVSQGIVEIGHGAAYYWKGKIEAAQFFSASARTLPLCAAGEWQDRQETPRRWWEPILTWRIA